MEHELTLHRGCAVNSYLLVNTARAAAHPVASKAASKFSLNWDK